MPKATSHDSTLCLNKSNDPSIPEKGLTLLAGVPTTVSAAQAAYLAKLSGVEIEGDSAPTKS